MFRKTSKVRLLLPASICCFVVMAMAGTAAAINVQVINNSEQQDSDVYLMMDGGSSADGQLPNDVGVPLSSINKSTFSIGSIQAGRLYISYGAPVVNSILNQSPTRYDKIEFSNPGVANLTAVDFFGIPFDLQALDSNGATVGEALSYSCHTSTVVPELQAVGASAEVTSGGNFVMFLSPQHMPDSYASMGPYIQSMAGKTVQVNDAFFGSPYQTMSYSGTFQSDGSITLNGTITTPSAGSTVTGSTVAITGASLPSAIYTGNGSYTVNSQPATVADNNQYSVIYRDIVAGFALGYWGGKYGNNSASWTGQPDFASARSSTDPFVAYSLYAAIIDRYSQAYGYSFHDVGPSAVTVPLNSSVATLELTIDSDQGPNTPGCVGSSTPSNPSTGGQVKVSVKTGSAKLSKKGLVKVKLGCTGDPCKGTLALTAKQAISKRRHRSRVVAERKGKRQKKKPKTMTLGSSTFSLAEGQSRNITVKISKKGINAIKSSRGKRLRATATAYVGPDSAQTIAGKGTVMLKSYVAKKRRRR